MDFSDFQLDLQNMVVRCADCSVPTIRVGDEVWFRARDAALLLGYIDTKKAVKAHVDEDWQKPFAALLREGGVKSPPTENLVSHDLNAKWISQSGLLELCASSKLPIAKRFKRWVFGEVLPSIFKTGAYTIPVEPEKPPATDAWFQKRLDGINTCKAKNGSLKEIIDGCLGGSNHGAVYPIVNNAVNQAVLNITETTRAFKARLQLPGSMSIADVLDYDGQSLRDTVECRFRQHFARHAAELKTKTVAEIICEIKTIGRQVRDANVLAGYEMGLDRVMDVGEAKIRKAGLKRQRCRVIAAEDVGQKKLTFRAAVAAA